ncbi:hypothetical protein CC86DRAFT_25563 [Ophiobolus disseminans]|uniref:Uncharacterized protein n=1 Tax=Ophiobolus disseminans TaxID=1469910 RepID=A0A6A7A0B8_9PLEO|nr:hypothetical protein CC86DRAFT_25563 [Ophiobolus disseminans]
MLWRGACAATRTAIVQPRRAVHTNIECPAPLDGQREGPTLKIVHIPVVSFVQSRLLHQPRSCHPASKSGQGRPAYFSTHRRLASHNTSTPTPRPVSFPRHPHPRSITSIAPSTSISC